MKKFYFSIFIVVFVLALYFPSRGQGICPLDVIKINKIEGKVFLNDPSQLPADKLKIVLLTTDGTETVVATTYTDEFGHFEMNNIKKGKYSIEVQLTVEGKIFMNYRVAVNVKKSNAVKAKYLIEINLGVNCFESETKIKKNAQ